LTAMLYLPGLRLCCTCAVPARVDGFAVPARVDCSLYHAVSTALLYLAGLTALLNLREGVCNLFASLSHPLFFVSVVGPGGLTGMRWACPEASKG
jgi:hypothetical protein